MLLLCTTDLELIAEHSKCLSIALRGSHLTRVIVQDKVLETYCYSRNNSPYCAVVAFCLWSLWSHLFMPQLRRSILPSEVWGGSVSRDVEKQQALWYPEEGFCAAHDESALW